MIVYKFKLDDDGKPTRNHKGTIILESEKIHQNPSDSLELVVKAHFGDSANFEDGETDSPLDIAVFNGENPIGYVHVTEREYELAFGKPINWGD